MKRWIRVSILSFAALAMILGVIAVTEKVQAAPGCICPMIYAPVICSNGKTYSNGCVAACAHATGCVPVIILPPPIQ